MLYRQFPQDLIYPNRKDIKDNKGRYPNRKTTIETLTDNQRDIQFLMGHYPFTMGKKLPAPPECIVFLRDPIQRAISNLYHLQRHSPQFKGIPIRALVEGANWQMNNLQVRYMSDGQFRPNKLYTAETKFGAKAIIRAKKHLNACAFVGFTERFEESIASLQQKFDWNLGRILTENTTPKQYESIPHDLHEKIAALNQLDIELYKYALSMIDD